MGVALRAKHGHTGNWNQSADRASSIPSANPSTSSGFLKTDAARPEQAQSQLRLAEWAMENVCGIEKSAVDGHKAQFALHGSNHGWEAAPILSFADDQYAN